MDFQATPLNITTLLVVALAVIALIYLFRGRYDSNLLFYSAAMLLTTLTDRSLNAYLLYSGVALALILRFEFMGKGFAKFVNLLTTSAIGLIVLSFLDQVFGDGTLLT
jgi:hypothetical protein